MKDEEFVKLKHWIDAEFTILHIQWAILLGFTAHNKLLWFGIIIYIIISIIYAASRLAYVESKHMGYLRLPRIR